jgi:hypothetical protein
MLGNPPVRHWAIVVSLDSRNLSERVDSVLIVPFGSQGSGRADCLAIRVRRDGTAGAILGEGPFH